MPRILVTGSSGQIGSFAVEECRRQGYDPVGLDIRPSAWTSVLADVRRPIEKMPRLDAVIHCAARVSVPESVSDPMGDAETNILGTLNVLNAAQSAGATRFVFLSSAAVYGMPSLLPLPEEAATAPLSPYGVSKLAGEHYARLARELQGMETVIVRPFNVYSRRQDPTSPYSGVLSKFAARAANGEPLQVYGDGSATRDFIHAIDIARFLVELCTCADSEPLRSPINLGSGSETTIGELAELVRRTAGLKAPVEKLPPRAGDIHRSVADVARMRAIGLTPRITLVEGIADLVHATAGTSSS